MKQINAIVKEAEDETKRKMNFTIEGYADVYASYFVLIQKVIEDYREQVELSK